MKPVKNIAVLLMFALGACATHPDEMVAAEPSAIPYAKYDCDQIATEHRRVTTEASNLWLSLKNKADGDAAQMGIGLVIFWPTLFFLEGGDGPQAFRYQQLKGEASVLERVGTKKKCSGIAQPDAQVVMVESTSSQAPTFRIPLVQRELTKREKDIFEIAEDCDTYHGAGGVGCKSPARLYQLRETELYNRCMGTKSGGELARNCKSFAVANTKAFKTYVQKQLRTTRKLPLPTNAATIKHAAT